MWLDDTAFRSVVDATPLVSIDLIIQNAQGDVLLGRRLNRPAQGYWFVPGGRILKSESLDAAFLRLTKSEVGQEFARTRARFLGVYEHFYTDSVFGESGSSPSTHYVALGYHLTLSSKENLTPSSAQHDQYRWWTIADMKQDVDIHKNTRAYLSALE